MTNGKVIEGDCVDNEGHGVKCDSESAEYDVIFSHFITDITAYPQDEFSSYDSKCPIETGNIFFPTINSWQMGDRNFLCVVAK